MFDNKIDVASIMNQIKAEIELSESDQEQGLYKDSKTDISDTIKEFERIQSFLINTLAANRIYVDIYQQNVPAYNRFGRIPAVFFRLLAKCIRKCNEYLFRNQIQMNTSTDACIQALIEGQAQLVKSFKHIENLFNVNIELMQKFEMIEKSVNSVCIVNDEKQMTNAMYVEFEDEYRGDEKTIKNRLKYYLDEVVVPCIEMKSENLILDIGCGRGEWLELLKEYGYNALGIEADSEMVRRCQQKKLDIVESDALEYIKSIPDNSVCMITSFQVIEHLQWGELNRLIKEMYRVLKKNGIIILETPNADNVEVGTYNFYLDPTHVKPVHSQLLEFVVQKVGFSETKILYWKEKEIEEWWENVLKQNDGKLMESPLFRTITETVKKKFYNSPDYALVGIK